MQTASVGKTFLRYTFFSVLGMVGISCYILADTFFIARGVGRDGLTALNLALPAYSVLHGTGLMIGMAPPPAFLSCRGGAKRKRETAYLRAPSVSRWRSAFYTCCAGCFSHVRFPTRSARAEKFWT